MTESESNGLTGWKPIETAPKDGRQILICFASKVTGEVVLSCVRWREERWLSGTTTDGVHIAVSSPTHWMEAPEPPANT